MARDSQDREDLLRDATAFKSRVQLLARYGERTVEVFAGFRSTDAVSLYFDQDPVYHFNNSGQLRRAFVNGRLIKAEAGRLIVWLPQRSESQVLMLRQEMTSGEESKLRQNLLTQFKELNQVIAQGDYSVEGQVSPDGQGDVLKRLSAFLGKTTGIEVADSPHVGR